MNPLFAARVWLAFVVSGSTVATGALAIHLAQTHEAAATAKTVTATQTVTSTTTVTVKPASSGSKQTTKNSAPRPVAPATTRQPVSPPSSAPAGSGRTKSSGS